MGDNKNMYECGDNAKSRKPTSEFTPKNKIDKVVSDAQGFNDVSESNNEEDKKERFSALIPKSTIEKIRDAVYTEKISGKFYTGQADIIEKAIDDYCNKYNVQERTEEYKEQENRGRKKK